MADQDAEDRLEQIATLGELMMRFTEFARCGKPEEIEVLAELLNTWSDHCGPVRAGNFFEGVVQALVCGDTSPLLDWPMVAERPKC